MEKETWREVTTVKLKKKERVIEKMQADNRVGVQKHYKSWREKISLQDQNHKHTLHISHAKWTRKIKEHSTHVQ